MSHVRPDDSPFKVVRWREGYEIGEVDSFLSQLTVGTHSDVDISKVRFTPTRLRPGYDMREVDAHLEAIANRYVPLREGSAGALHNRASASRARPADALRRLVRRRRFQLGIALLATAIALRWILGPGNTGIGCTNASIRLQAGIAIPLFSGFGLLASMMPNRLLGSGRVAVVKWGFLVLSLTGIATSLANIAGVHVGLGAGCP